MPALAAWILESLGISRLIVAGISAAGRVGSLVLAAFSSANIVENYQSLGATQKLEYDKAIAAGMNNIMASALSYIYATVDTIVPIKSLATPIKDSVDAYIAYYASNNGNNGSGGSSGGSSTGGGSTSGGASGGTSTSGGGTTGTSSGAFVYRVPMGTETNGGIKQKTGGDNNIVYFYDNSNESWNITGARNTIQALGKNTNFNVKGSDNTVTTDYSEDSSVTLSGNFLTMTNNGLRNQIEDFGTYNQISIATNKFHDNTISNSGNKNKILLNGAGEIKDSIIQAVSGSMNSVEITASAGQVVKNQIVAVGGTSNSLFENGSDNVVTITGTGNNVRDSQTNSTINITGSYNGSTGGGFMASGSGNKFEVAGDYNNVNTISQGGNYKFLSSNNSLVDYGSGNTSTIQSGDTNLMSFGAYNNGGTSSKGSTGSIIGSSNALILIGEKNNALVMGSNNSVEFTTSNLATSVVGSNNKIKAAGVGVWVSSHGDNLTVNTTGTYQSVSYYGKVGATSVTTDGNYGNFNINGDMATIKSKGNYINVSDSGSKMTLDIFAATSVNISNTGLSNTIGVGNSSSNNVTINTSGTLNQVNIGTTGAWWNSAIAQNVTADVSGAANVLKIAYGNNLKNVTNCKVTISGVLNTVDCQISNVNLTVTGSGNVISALNGNSQIQNAKMSDLLFTKSGNNLNVYTSGTNNQITFNNWYAAGSSKTSITGSDWRSASAAQIDLLVSQMASIAPPSAGQLFSLNSTQQAQINSALSAARV